MVIDSEDKKDLRFKNPERLLLVVIAFIFWSVGFLDLLGHTDPQPEVLGFYSLPTSILIVLYGSMLAIWVVLFSKPDILSRVVKGIEYIQSKTWLVLSILTVFAFAFWVIFEWSKWASFPGLQLSVFVLVLLATLILVFSGWREHRKVQWWRRVIAYPLFALVAVEAVVQIVALLGILPGIQNIGGEYIPYERVYQNGEGFRNGYANRYGFYFPDFELNDDNRRILLLGGSYVQALQVSPEQQVSALLSDLMNQNQKEDVPQTEVAAMGLSGFGPSPLLFDEVFQRHITLRGADEIILFLHLGDDFQSASPSANPIVYTVGEDGTVEVQNAPFEHNLGHFFLRGYLSFQPVEILRSNYLTPKAIEGFARTWANDAQATSETTVQNSEFDIPRLKGSVTDIYTINEGYHVGIKDTHVEKIPDGNNFMFKRGDNPARDASIAIVAGLLQQAQDIALANGVPFRIVTIPTFPKAFYNQASADNWEPELGDYDLFLPERALAEIAQQEDIPMVSMGQYMYEDGLGINEINELYYLDGQGHFTPKGHEYFANAVYSCFFADQQSQNSENSNCSVVQPMTSSEK